MASNVHGNVDDLSDTGPDADSDARSESDGNDHLGSPSTSDPLPIQIPNASNTDVDPDTTSDTSPPMHSSLQRLLRCPVCSARFQSPTTLHCGHTVCQSHLCAQSPTCPVQPCAPIAPAPPNIPSSSNVSYHPVPHDPHSTPPLSLPITRVDVTISKIISLIATLNTELAKLDKPPQLHSDSDLSDDENNHDDTDTPPFNPPSSSSSAIPSRTRPRSDSTGSPERPRKRRRRHQPSHSDHDADSDDLLSHLRRQSARQRSTRHDQPLIPSAPPSNPDSLLANFQKDLLSELTCEICFTLFYQPVTTPCQHTFCTRCLHRSLDHSPSCPLCRQDLPGFSYFQEHPENKLVLSLILKAFPTTYQERGETIEAEERDARLDTPIFVCQLSFPGVPILLHFFEPRYRLMLRRCLESPRPCFGMIMPPRPGGTSPQMEYGTMLEIRSVQMLADGRSMVETWGTYRFRLLSSGTLDGYMVGRIERIDDYPEDLMEAIPERTGATSSTRTTSEGTSTASTSTSNTPQPPPPPSPSTGPRPTPSRHPTNAELMARCRTFLEHLQRGTAPWVVQRLSSTYGAMPTDASLFSFWVALVLPIDEHEKAKLLPIRSARLRLLLVVHWIEQLNNNWYRGRNLLMWIVLLIGTFFFYPFLALGNDRAM